MDTWIKLNAQTVGKDKLARLVQYFSRVLWYYVQQRRRNPYTVDKLKSLEYTLSTFRKLLRLGKSSEVLYAAFKSIHYEDATVKLTSTLSKISSALFLLTDHILWIGRSGLATVNTTKWSEISNKYWLYSVIMNLIRDFYEIMRIVDQENIRLRINSRSSQNEISRQVVKAASVFVNDHKSVFWDTVKNTCDVWIPLTALGYTKFKPGTIGFLGTISSIAGIISLIDPHAKLLPS